MTAQKILLNLLQAYDLNTLEYKNWILINEQLPAINASIQNLKIYENGVSLRLDIAILLENKNVIWESFTGIGKDELSATQNAFHTFSMNSLPVIFSAFWQIEENEQIGREEWKINGDLWEVYVGNFGCKGDFNIPTSLFSTLEEAIKNKDLTKNLYWFRVYYANINEKENMVEALINNKSWKDLENKIQNLNWEKSDAFYSLQNFIILQKKKIPNSNIAE